MINLPIGVTYPAMAPHIAADGGTIKTGNLKFSWGLIFGLAVGVISSVAIYYYCQKNNPLYSDKIRVKEKQPADNQ